MNTQPDQQNVCENCGMPLNQSDGGCYYPECNKPSPAQNGGEKNHCDSHAEFEINCPACQVLLLKPTPEPSSQINSNLVTDEPEEPSSQHGEWKVGTAFRDGRWHCKIFDDNNSIALGSGSTKEEAEATAKRIVEDHNVKALLSPTAWEEARALLEERNSLRAELARAREENGKLREAVTQFAGHHECCKGKGKCDCGTDDQIALFLDNLKAQLK